MLSHGNLLGNATQLLARTDVNPSDRMLAALPVFHSFGLTGGILLPLLVGARVLTYPNPLHYKAIPELARKERVTVVFGTDTFLSGWGRRAEDGDFASVRAAIAGAEAVKPATRALWQDRFGAAILEGYGATEASPVLALNTPARRAPRHRRPAPPRHRRPARAGARHRRRAAAASAARTSCAATSAPRRPTRSRRRPAAGTTPATR